MTLWKLELHGMHFKGDFTILELEHSKSVIMIRWQFHPHINGNLKTLTKSIKVTGIMHNQLWLRIILG